MAAPAISKELEALLEQQAAAAPPQQPRSKAKEGPAQFTASIDEDAAQRWRKRSSKGEAGVHCIEVPLRAPEKPISEFPVEMKHKLHEEYVASYLQDKIGVHPSAYNTKLAKGQWPVRLQDTEVTATFKSRGNQGDKLFMTPSVAATTRPAQQLIKGDDILGLNMVARPTLQRAESGAAAASAASTAGSGAEDDDARESPPVTFDDFKEKFVFPFYLRAKLDSSGAARGAVLHEQYHANRASRKKYGKGPSREMIAAYEQRNAAKPRAKGGAAAGRNQEGQRRPGRVDSMSLTCDGIPWNPFIEEDLEVIAEGRKPVAVTLHQVKGVQELLVGVLPINDLRDRLGTHELQQLVEEIRAMSTTRLIVRLVHFLCHKLMETTDPAAGAPSAAAAKRAGPPRNAAWESAMFVRIYEGYADMYARLRRKRSCSLFHLPVMLLCIRGACETLFRDVYPSYTKSSAGRQLLHDVDAAVAAMFDPDSWHSKISIFESSVDAMRIVRDPALRGSSNHDKMGEKVYGTSPVIRSLFAGDFSSAFTKRQASVAAATSTPHEEASAGGHMLPMEVRQKLFRSALERVTQRARKHGVVITKKGGQRMGDSREDPAAKARVGDGALGSDPDDAWLFTDRDENDVSEEEDEEEEDEDNN